MKRKPSRSKVTKALPQIALQQMVGRTAVQNEAARLGLIQTDDPVKAEAQLTTLLPEWFLRAIEGGIP